MPNSPGKKLKLRQSTDEPKYSTVMTDQIHFNDNYTEMKLMQKKVNSKVT